MRRSVLVGTVGAAQKQCLVSRPHPTRPIAPGNGGVIAALLPVLVTD